MHPGTFGNINEVWQVESRELEREQQALDNEKKLKEERQAEELLKIKVDAGILPQSHLERLDFIYKDAPENNDKYKTKDMILKDNKEKKQIIPRIDDSITNPKNELFSRIHEDPLFMMKKEEMKKRKEIEDNPYQMKLLLKEIEEDLLKEENEHKRKKAKREKEKEILSNISKAKLTSKLSETDNIKERVLSSNENDKRKGKVSSNKEYNKYDKTSRHYNSKYDNYEKSKKYDKYREDRNYS